MLRAMVSLPQGIVEINTAMIVNPEGYIPTGAYNPHGVQPWIIGDDGDVVVAIVFAPSAQEALDEAINAGRLEGSSGSASPATCRFFAPAPPA